MTSSFKRKIQIIAAKILFPVIQQDWYRSKGYGKNGTDPFDDFLEQQRSNRKAIYHEEFTDLDIKRTFIDSLDCRGNKNKLDSISIKPLNSENKQGSGIHIVNFFGRGEYYEMNFRDMARQAKATGATIHAYNPPGMNSSTGHVLQLDDLINAGVAQINNLLKQGIHPDKIIIQGNCMGAAVAEEVNKHFENTVNIKFRRINSNSFKSMNSLLTNLYPVLNIVKDKVKKLLEFTGWYTKPGANFMEIDPYKVYMNRQGDRTIMPKAQMHAKVAKEKLKKENNSVEDVSKIDTDYEEHRKWLDEHAIMELDEDSYPADRGTDAHELDLYKLKCAKKDESYSAYDFVNYYIKASSDYIEKHKVLNDHVENHPLKSSNKLAPYKTENNLWSVHSEEQIETIAAIAEEIYTMVQEDDLEKTMNLDAVENGSLP